MRTPCIPTRCRGMALAVLATAAGAVSRAAEGDTEALRAELNELRSEIADLIGLLAQRISQVEERQAAVRAPAEAGPPGLPPWPGFEFHGYIRSGYGVDGKGNVQEAFRAPNAGAKYRLGNEAETYVEASFRQNLVPEDSEDVSFYTHLTGAYVTPLKKSNRFDTETALREAYALGRGVWRGAPDVAFWAGERFYDRWDVHMNDFFYRDLSGYGGGVEDVALGELGRFAAAWIGGSVDELEPSGTPFPEDRYRFNKNTADLRLYDIPLPLGSAQVTASLSDFDEDTFTSGDDIAVRVRESTGWSAGFFHELKGKGDTRNVLAAQYGDGAAENFLGVLTPPAGIDLAAAEVIDVDEMWRFRLVDDFVLSDGGPLALQTAAVYEEIDNGQPDRNRITWVSLGLRPIWQLTRYLGIACEAGWDYTDQEDGPNGSLYKLTLAPEVHPGTAYFDRPSLRTFFTYAWWSDDFRGLVAPDSFAAKTEGLSAGVQLETWW